MATFPNPPLVFHGTLIHSLAPTNLEIIENGLLIVGSDGKIQAVIPSVDRADVTQLVSRHGLGNDINVTYLDSGEFLCPGFVDTHNHAPQWAQRGMGRSLLLLDWLNDVTFSHEAKFEDPEYAKRMYASCVTGFLRMGITTASYYGSKHGKATKILADVCLEKGQRALVGKCNMNRNAPDWYRDMTTEDSLEETKDFIKYMREKDPEKELVTPIITPRFAISCTDDLLEGLGQISLENPDLPVQTHFEEAETEIQYTKELFPQFDNEADLYEHFNLLNDRSILAHSIYVSEYEIGRLQALKCGVAHCPAPNTTTGIFGIAPVREYLRRGIKVGLGTDSGGGYSSSMLDTIRLSFVVGNAKEWMSKGEDHCISVKEGFFLATLGGAQVCCLDHKIGNFIVGKEFDALEVHTIGTSGTISPIESDDTLEDVWEKFVMTGDDRNIAKVFVRGRQVK